MKKLLCGLLTLLFCFSAALPAFAYYTEIIGIDEDEFGFGGYSKNGGPVDKFSTSRDFAYLAHTRPGTTYFLPLRRKDFKWENDSGSPITMRNIPELGLSLNFYDDKKGSHLFDAIKFAEQDGQTGILIDFVDELDSTEIEEFEIIVQLLVFDEAFPGSTFKIKGSVSNRSIPVSSYTKSCTLGQGRQAVGYDSAKGVRFEMEHGLFILSDITFTDKYYASADNTVYETDRTMMAQYPQITEVIRLKTIGLQGKVNFERPETRYVYDETLTYLGTTDTPVPHRSTYYLAEKPIV